MLALFCTSEGESDVLRRRGQHRRAEKITAYQLHYGMSRSSAYSQMLKMCDSCMEGI